MARKDDSNVSRKVNSRMEMTQKGIFNFPSRPKNILHYLVHRFLFRESKLTHLVKWDYQLKKYVTNPANGVPPTPEARTSARGNATSQVFSDDESMSMSTFVKAAVIAGAVKIDTIVIWEMEDGQRIVGKVRYPLTPDTLMNLNDEDRETDLIAQVAKFIKNGDKDTTDQSFTDLVSKIQDHKSKQKVGE